MSVIDECGQRISAEVLTGTDVDGRTPVDLSRAAACPVVAVQDLERRVALNIKRSVGSDSKARIATDQPPGVVERRIQRSRHVNAARPQRDVPAVVDLAVCILNN